MWNACISKFIHKINFDAIFSYVQYNDIIDDLFVLIFLNWTNSLRYVRAKLSMMVVINSPNWLEFNFIPIILSQASVILQLAITMCLYNFCRTLPLEPLLASMRSPLQISSSHFVVNKFRHFCFALLHVFISFLSFWSAILSIKELFLMPTSFSFLKSLSNFSFVVNSSHVLSRIIENWVMTFLLELISLFLWQKSWICILERALVWYNSLFIVVIIIITHAIWLYDITSVWETSFYL